jgi:hypothetical protein
MAMKGFCGSGHVSIANIPWKTIRNVDVVQNQKVSMELWGRRGGQKSGSRTLLHDCEWKNPGTWFSGDQNAENC